MYSCMFLLWESFFSLIVFYWIRWVEEANLYFSESYFDFGCVKLNEIWQNIELGGN